MSETVIKRNFKGWKKQLGKKQHGKKQHGKKQHGKKQHGRIGVQAESVNGCAETALEHKTA
ncbi:hypothetical protein [Leucobacter sp. OH1287]|uniref:hypothetical protein n=1 Tax=Leucobacter sp. OH1287 TaxID=2491049 RepID=UPI001315A9E9|nr:hypothetical protein [Leucobacter sp. OH1287]